MQSNSPTAVPTHARYGVVVFAIVLAMIQYIDRVAISNAQTVAAITSDLSLTMKQMSYVFSAFTLAYALFEIPTGFWGDRIGAKKVLLRVVLWWSAFTAFTGMAFSLVSLVVIRFLFGAGEAGCFPNLARAFKRWLTPGERARAQGTLWMCARWGGAAAPLLFFWLQKYMTWRQAFFVFAGVGVVWAVFFWLWFRDNPREHKSVNAAEAALLPADESAGEHLHVPWRKLFRSKTVWCLCGQYFAIAYGWYFFVTWFPTYLKQVHGFDMKANALLAGTPLLLGGCGCFVAGWITPMLTRRWGASNTRRLLGAGGLFAGAVLLIVSTVMTNPYLAVAAIALTSFSNDLAMPGAWTACMEFGGRYVGTLGGTMNMMGNLGGFLSPLILAWLVETTGSWTLAFYVTAAVAVGGAICWLMVDTTTSLEEQVKD